MEHDEVLEVEQLAPRRTVCREQQDGAGEDGAGDAKPEADRRREAADQRHDQCATDHRAGSGSSAQASGPTPANASGALSVRLQNTGNRNAR